jgi:hypothetical protein
MHDNDEDIVRRFPDESPVEVRCPRSKQEEQGKREQWPWLPGTIVEQCGSDEWYVCIEVRELAVLRDGRPAPRGTASHNLYYPCCYRDGSEIRPRTASSGATSCQRAPGYLPPASVRLPAGPSEDTRSRSASRIGGGQVDADPADRDLAHERHRDAGPGRSGPRAVQRGG